MSYDKKNKDKKKHSGCQVKRWQKNGKSGVCITGWRYTKGVLYSFIVSPYHGTKETKSETGKRWANWIFKLTNTTTGETSVKPCLVNLDNFKFYINKANLMGNPKGGKGGYFGKHISNDYNND